MVWGCVGVVVVVCLLYSDYYTIKVGLYLLISYNYINIVLIGLSLFLSLFYAKGKGCS